MNKSFTLQRVRQVCVEENLEEGCEPLVSVGLQSLHDVPYRQWEHHPIDGVDDSLRYGDVLLLRDDLSAVDGRDLEKEKLNNRVGTGK